ncbi:hypothetical protein F0562_017582 [Nyssa sinensis]|uniref:Uncharacterized protein n=1 Tax=Nyssa sinensis TaxID=561372 RepID=A0A5J4ZGZ2_9ASTE|nr:hypothetical protein F0562_017582 [Nyssa sinensis]
MATTLDILPLGSVDVSIEVRESIELLRQKELAVVLREHGNHRQSLRLSLKNIFGRNGVLTSWTAEPAARQYKEDLGRALFLYVGSHPSQLEPAWEDMKLCKTVAVMIRGGLFGLDEAIRCCHDCLYALLTATAARI